MTGTSSKLLQADRLMWVQPAMASEPGNLITMLPGIHTIDLASAACLTDSAQCAFITRTHLLCASHFRLPFHLPFCLPFHLPFCLPFRPGKAKVLEHSVH